MKASLLFLFSGIFFSSTIASTTSITFRYQYEIVANSYHPFDEGAIYAYKEQLIETYESLCFGMKESDYETLIKANIDRFEQDEFTVASYRNGKICLQIGQGKGHTFKGNLRKNECDESVIRERFYIFELFT